MKKLIIFSLLFVCSVNANAAKIIRVSTQSEITESEFFSELAVGQNIILGEKHYTPKVQQGEADIIRGVVFTQQRDFTLGWEFLNSSEKPKIDLLFSDFLSGKITSLDFLMNTQGGTSASSSYSVVLETVKQFNGKLIPLNLSRAEKTPVITGGISAADPKLVPAGFKMGDSNYSERFFEAMNGHQDDSTIQNYFAAQCLTDDVMAVHLIEDSKTELNFLIAGSFHTDYFSGTVARIMSRRPEMKTMVVRVTDASDLEIDPKYGPIADYIYYVSEE